jgi:hypothetical protein
VFLKVLEKFLQPALWVEKVAEGEIHLSVESGLFERLPENQTTDQK